MTLTCKRDSTDTIIEVVAISKGIVRLNEVDRSRVLALTCTREPLLII